MSQPITPHHPLLHLRSRLIVFPSKIEAQTLAQAPTHFRRRRHRTVVGNGLPVISQVASAAAAAGQQGKTNVIRRLRQGNARGGGGGSDVTSLDIRVFVMVVGIMGCLLVAASLVMSEVHQVQFRRSAISMNFRGLQELKQKSMRREQAEQITHGRLLQMETSAITKNESEGRALQSSTQMENLCCQKQLGR